MNGQVNTELLNLLTGQALQPGGIPSSIPPTTLQSPGEIGLKGAKPGMDWDLLGIMMGQAGQALAAPGSWQSRLGGTAAGLGQSRKMAQAAAKQSKQRSADWEWLRSIMTGQTPMTPQGMEGVSKMEMGKVGSTGLPEVKLSVTPNKELMDSMFNLSPGMTNLGGGTTPTESREGLADISPFSIGPTGISAADLVGLSPEQILAVMGEQRQTEQFRSGTFLDALRTLGALAPKPIEQWVTSKPDEFGRVYRTNLATGKKELVSGAVPEKGLTFEQRKELAKIPSDIPRGGYWSKGDDTIWVPAGQNPPAGYVQSAEGISPLEMARLNISLENLGLSKERAKFAKERATTTAAQNIRLNPKNEAMKADVQFYNTNAPDTSPVGFIWVTQKKKWAADINEAHEVPLPMLEGKQLTMKDVRQDAKDRGVTTEVVLKEIYDWMASQEK